MTRLGDFLQAVHKLQPEDDAGRARLAALFGLEFRRSGAEPGAQARDAEPGAAPRRGARRRDRASEEKAGKLPEPVPCALEQLEGDRPQPPAWLEGKSAALARHEHPSRRLAPAKPLIAPNKVRAILSEMFACEAESDAPDIPRLVDMVSRNEVIRLMPRLRRRKLARQVLLLVDTGMGMEPFARDQIRVAGDARRLMGSDRVTVRSFIGTPLAGLIDPASFVAETFQRGVQDRIVVLGDWSAAPVGFDPDRATQSEWLEFAEAARDTAIAVLSPYPEARRPAVRHQRVAFFHWSETLAVGRIRSIRRRAERSGM